MTKDYAHRAAEIMHKILYVTVATVSPDGQPWNSPVYCGFDDDLTFYWTSDKDGLHSENIRQNKKVFLVIYDSTVPEGTGEGVYILAEASELKDVQEIRIARRVTQGRKGKESSEGESVAFIGDAIRRVYRAVPKRAWMNGDEEDKNGNFIRDIRVEVPLAELSLKIFEIRGQTND